MTTPEVQEALESLLRRSEELCDALMHKVQGALFDTSDRGAAVLGMCSVSLEHALSLRLLIANGCGTSAIALMRLQYESLTRAMWLLYVAPESAIGKLTAPLTRDSEQAAKGLPSVNEMLDQLRKGIGTKLPAAAYDMLHAFRQASWASLNSYVHAGVHALNRHADGYPLQLILDVLRNSNALVTMAGMTQSLLTGDERIARAMRGIQIEFADCLPELQAHEIEAGRQ